VLRKHGQLAASSTRIDEAVGCPLKNAVPSDIAEEQNSGVSALNPERAFATFKSAFTLEKFQLGVGRKNLIEARIEPDNSARGRSLGADGGTQHRDRQQTTHGVKEMLSHFGRSSAGSYIKKQATSKAKNH
jgi:hypothetical protein